MNEFREIGRRLWCLHAGAAEPRVALDEKPDLGLTELLARDPDRTGAHLHVRDRGQLVRLDVRAEGEAMLVAVALHPCDVALDGVEVDSRDRRVQRGDVHVSR